MTSCAFWVRGAPRDGECALLPSANRDLADGCDVELLNTAYINCSGWAPGCSGGFTGFTYTLQKETQDGSIVSINVRQGDGKGNTKEPLETRVGKSAEYSVQVCSMVGACKSHALVPITACAAVSPSASEELVMEVVAEAEECLLQQNAECAQEKQQSLADYAEPCDGESNSVLIESLIAQAIELFHVIVSAQGDVGKVSTDLSPLLDLFATIAEKSCDGSVDLFDILLDLCEAENFSPDLGAVALNNLYNKLVENTNGTTLLDSALDISLCLQSTLRQEDSICGEKETVQYEGEAVTYYVFNVPIPELDGPDRTVLSTPNITISLPPFFLKQIEENLNGTGITEQDLPTLSCISVHVVSARVADPCIGTLCEEGSSLGSQGVSGIDFYIEGKEPILLSLSHLTDVRVIMLKRDTAIQENRLGTQESRNNHPVEERFALTATTEKDSTLCAYYNGDGSFTRDCTFLFTENGPEGVLVHCECPHFSNFGVLFDAGTGGEEWTTYRVVSLGMLGGMWVLLLAFFALTLVSTTFQECAGLETSRAKNSRVLGNEI